MPDVTARLLLVVETKPQLKMTWRTKETCWFIQMKMVNWLSEQLDQGADFTSLQLSWFCLLSHDALVFRLIFITTTKMRKFHTSRLPEEERVSISQPPHKILGLTLTEPTWVARPPLNPSQGQRKYNTMFSVLRLGLCDHLWNKHVQE